MMLRGRGGGPGLPRSRPPSYCGGRRGATRRGCDLPFRPESYVPAGLARRGPAGPARRQPVAEERGQGTTVPAGLICRTVHCSGSSCPCGTIMGWPSRSGPAGRPISAPLRSQAAPRPGGTCSRPAARFHLPPGATARVASSLIKLVSAAPGGTCPRPAARLLLPPGATARVASSLIEPVPAAPGGTCPPARGPLLPATGRYGPRGASAPQAGARSTWGNRTGCVYKDLLS